jgi:hypothetical protein
MAFRGGTGANGELPPPDHLREQEDNWKIKQESKPGCTSQQNSDDVSYQNYIDVVVYFIIPFFNVANRTMQWIEITLFINVSIAIGDAEWI